MINDCVYATTFGLFRFVSIPKTPALFFVTGF